MYPTYLKSASEKPNEMENVVKVDKWQHKKN